MKRLREKHMDAGTRNKKYVRILCTCIAACLLFCAGFLVRDNEILMARMGVIPPLEGSTGDIAQNTSSTVCSAHLGEVEGIIVDSSVASYDSDAASMAAINAYLIATKDPYASYFDADRYTTYIDVNKSQYPGVGVYFAEYEGQAYAVDVFEGSSAAIAGVQPGDFVVGINGDRRQSWTATEAINAVHGEEGSSVVITWRRPESIDKPGGTEFTTTLTYSQYEVENVTTEKIGRVGYITLHQIGQNADELVTQAIKSLTNEGAEAFILDLRNNAGGYLTEAVNVSSLFIKNGVIVEIETKDSSTTKQANGSVVTEAPLVVLVNENTAGSAEVITAALKDSGRATIVGTKTMGKGSVQMVKPLSFGGALRYTVARYNTPSGATLDGIGVSPDIVVSLNEGSTDNQKELALEGAQMLLPEAETEEESA